MTVQRNFAGIYWTRPVPWANFRYLSEDVDIAATESRTIRYQRELIRRHVRQAGGALHTEIALMEVAPDRATPEAMAELLRAVNRTPEEVTFIYVDFGAAYGWREHPYLRQALERRRAEPVYPDSMLIDGQNFDPVAHFRKWRDVEARRRALAPEHVNLVRMHLAECGASTLAAAADALNRADIRTPTGKHWTADSLRKFRKLHGV